MLPRVADYGLGKIVGTSTEVTRCAGTAQWMAPEQVFTQNYGAPVDVFAYAVVLFELLTEAVPYDGKSQADIYRMLEKSERPFIPAELENEPVADLIGQCWAEDPAERPTFDQICELFGNELVLFPGTRRRGLAQLLRFIERHEHTHDFVPRNDLVVLKKSMKNGVDADAIAEEAGFGSIRHFTELVTISKQINVNILDRQKAAPLHRAVNCQETAMVSFLLQIQDIDVNVRSPKGATPLLIAVFTGNLEIVRLLLDDKRVDVNAQDDDKNSALHMAVEKRYVAIVQALVKCRDIKLDQKGPHKLTPLKLANSKKFTEIETILTDAIKHKKK
jgi:hypothetical protein